MSPPPSFAPALSIVSAVERVLELATKTPYRPGGICLGTGCDCWGFVREMLLALGIQWPGRPEEALALEDSIATPLADGEAARLGDVVIFKQNDQPHVGVCLDAFRVAHFSQHGWEESQCALRTDRLDTIRRVGAVSRIVRPTSIEHRQLAPAREPGSIRVTLYDDVVARTGRRQEFVPLWPGSKVTARMLAAKMLGRPAAPLEPGVPGMAIVVNGTPIAPGADIVLQAGDELVAAPSPGDPVDAVLIAIAVVSAALSFVLTPKLKGLPAGQSDSPAENRYGFGRTSIEAFSGDAIPTVLGELWTGGKVIALVPGEGIDGQGDNRIKMLIVLSHGICAAGEGIAAIGNQTADFDRVRWDQITGIELNDQPIANFPNCYVSGRMGTSGQAPIPGFQDVEVAREVGVGGIKLDVGVTGTFTTVNPIDAAVFRILMPKGLYSLSPGGQVEPHTVEYRIRSREATGPGAWTAWTNFTITKTEQSPFYSAPRLSGFGGTRREFQVERVTAAPADATIIDDLTWETLVEIDESTEAYAGLAILALDLTASEQLTGTPSVSVLVKGLGKVRIWDGISDPSSPTFTTGYSNNPADLALEVITNSAWGMGAGYELDDVIMPSLLSWRTKCVPSVPTPEGVTRPRFACNLLLNSAKKGVEWLRTICATGRCVPLTAGGKWRFNIEDVQTIAEETFTDATIAADENGRAMFQYTREKTTDGLARPTRTVCQFQNARGKSDVAAYPIAEGDLWLATEPLVEETERLDGVTDKNQAATEAKYRQKRKRGLGRAVKFTTTKQFVKCQPGDRIDVACSVVGWGLASGRVLAGCTSTGVRLDRTVTLAVGTTYTIRIIHADGSIEDKTVASSAGTYAAGSLLSVSSAFAATPAVYAEYAIGPVGTALKPFLCNAVRPTEGENRILWEIEAAEYSADVFDDTNDEVVLPEYTTLGTVFTPPGPVLELRAYDRVVGGRRQAELSWRQNADDARITGVFRVFRRIVSTSTWVLIPDAKISTRGALLEIVDTDRAYEFAVVAVSQGGQSLSPYDPRVPTVILVFGLSAPPPEPPTGLVATNTGGNTYTLSWDAVEGAVGYQVLFGGDTTTKPNVGAEDCLVLARVEGTTLAGLELPPGRACRFWVRSVGRSGRLSFTAAEVNVASPATPAGEVIKLTTTHTLSGGTLTNLTWDSGASMLRVADPDLDGVWTSPEIDTGAETVTELTFRPGTANDAEDPDLDSDPFTVPSIAADQWGLFADRTVGMIFPPWPDAMQAWKFEVRTKSGGVYSDWGVVAPCASVRRSFREYQIRVTMNRREEPYIPALRTLVTVTTN